MDNWRGGGGAHHKREGGMIMRERERERDVWNNREGLHSIMTFSKLRDMYRVTNE